MSLSFSSSVSGIRAAFGILGTSAHNTANINNAGFEKQHVSLSEDKNGGVIVKIRENNKVRPLNQDTDGATIGVPNFDYSEEIVEQMNAKHILSANISVITRTDETLESLMDIVA